MTHLQREDCELLLFSSGRIAEKSAILENDFFTILSRISDIFDELQKSNLDKLFIIKIFDYLQTCKINYVPHHKDPGVYDEQKIETTTQWLLFQLYRDCVNSRPCLRQEMGRFLREFAISPLKSCLMNPTLRVLFFVVEGMDTENVLHSLLFDLVLPLYNTNEFRIFDRQELLLINYHESLENLVHLLIRRIENFRKIKVNGILPLSRKYVSFQVIKYLLTRSLPRHGEVCTPKTLIILNSVSSLIFNAKIDLVDEGVNVIFLEILQDKLLPLFIHCLGQENSQLIQATLRMWTIPNFLQLIKPNRDLILETLLPLLFRHGKPFWNQTCNNMISAVLDYFETEDPVFFQETCQKLGMIKKRDEVSKAKQQVEIKNESVSKLLDEWKKQGRRGQISSAVTGVAPWAVKRQNQIPEKLLSRIERKNEKEQISGYQAVRDYQELLREMSKKSKSDRHWILDLQSEKPRLLPDLKFHKLVFGHDLGHGTFSQVKYCRQILTDRKQTEWPEYACKIISYETIEKYNYAKNVSREIAILESYDHPSLTRLISSFRWDHEKSEHRLGAAYLILEYGALGDLLSLLNEAESYGSSQLATETCLQIAAEVGTGLEYLHQEGFLFCDCKLENVVMTSEFHCKLTDFGGCRPYTEKAEELVKYKIDAVNDLRDGSWKPAERKVRFGEGGGEEEKITCEGTELYLAPELKSRMKFPTLKSDAWSYGVLLYRLSIGEFLKKTLSSVDENSQFLENFEERVDEVKLKSLEPREAEGLRQLLQAEEKRMTVGRFLDSEFFQKDPRSFYRNEMSRPKTRSGHLLYGGFRVPEESDSRWERRQFSVLWTVVPEARLRPIVKLPMEKTNYHSIDEMEIEKDIFF